MTASALVRLPPSKVCEGAEETAAATARNVWPGGQLCVRPCFLMAVLLGSLQAWNEKCLCLGLCLCLYVLVSCMRACHHQLGWLADHLKSCVKCPLHCLFPACSFPGEARGCSANILF